MFVHDPDSGRPRSFACWLWPDRLGIASLPVAGVTIGGHADSALSASRYPVYEGKTITEAQATTLLLVDVQSF